MKKFTGDVELYEYHLREIPDILNDVVIDGGFNICDNNIKTLNNFPADCYAIYLSGNPITSLVGIKQKYVSFLEANRLKISNLDGCPEEVKVLIVQNNQRFNSLQGSLKKISEGGTLLIKYTSLSSLDGLPVIGNRATVDLSYNKLTSLIGMPKKCHNFRISGNPLTNLIGGPEHITGNFDCYEHKLQNFDGFPRIIEGNVNMSIGGGMFNNPLMKVKSYFEKELRSRCKIYGYVSLSEHYEQI